MTYGILCAGLFVIIGIIYKLYPIHRINYNYLKTFFESSVIWLVCSTFLAYFGAGFIFMNGISRLVIVFGFVLSMILILIIDTLLDVALPSHRQKLLIINNTDNEEIIWNLREFESMDQVVIPFQDEFYFKDLIKKYEPHSLLVLGDVPRESLQYLADKANIAGIDMVHVSEGMLLDDLNFQITRLGPLLGLQYHSHIITERDAVIKRICDILWSAVALILLSPVMIVTAIWIKILDKWPILYKHKRVGRNGKMFDYIKFRSMYVEYCTGDYFGTSQSQEYRDKLQKSELNVRKGELQKIQNDPRITPIGRIIRKYSIDELPSLWCVLKGDMSMIGPRPHLDFEVERYQPRMKRLLSVKPGMTCYSQIYGRDKLPFTDEAKFDIYYIQNWSLIFDLYIVVATFKVLFTGR
jgi:exopolysaccharide biosynthesis polyprenyl glycosylphosphotransferase